MKSYFKNLIVAGAAALTFLTATPMIYADTKSKITEDYKTISQYYQLENDQEKINRELSKKTNKPSTNKANKDLAAKINKDLTNIKQQINQKKIPIKSFNIYGKDLTLEDYTKIIEATNKYDIKGDTLENFIRLSRIMKEEHFIDQVAEYYKINKQDMFRIWNQESNLYIRALGKHGERGMAQFQESTAKLVFDRLISPGDSLYFEWKNFYPEFNIKKYDFKQLSQDYKLNIIMTAAQVRINESMLNYFLKKAGVSKDKLIRIVKQKGTTTTFEKLREVAKNPQMYGLNKDLELTLKNYSLSNQRVSQINKIYNAKGNLLPRVITYIIHNGGEMAVQNMIDDTFAGELLLYHLAMYINNLGGLYNLMNYHYGGLENMVKSNETIIQNMTQGEIIDLWGNEIKKLDVRKLKSYALNGLIENVNHLLLEKNTLVLVKNYTIDENFNLQQSDPSLIKVCSVNDPDELYNKLIMFKQLEQLQNSLNKEYELKNDKKAKSLWTKIVSLETEINKKFKMQRAHTGIVGIQKDISRIENDLKKSGFIPDIEKYKVMITPKLETDNRSSGY